MFVLFKVCFELKEDNLKTEKIKYVCNVSIVLNKFKK